MWRQIIWQRSGGYYLFWTGVVYLVVGATNVFWLHFCSAEYLSAVWVATMMLPFAIPQLGRWLNMSMPWDQKEQIVPDNVVPFPEPKLASVPDPRPEEHYRVGFNSAGDTTLTLLTDSGASMTLTMTRDATEQLIKMLRATYPDEE